MERKNIVLSDEDGEFALTIMYPMSHEFDGKLFVIYEDSFGDVEFKVMTPKAIVNNYNVDLEEINVFIKTAIRNDDE